MKIHIEGVDVSNNGRDGIRLTCGGGEDITIRNITANNNGGMGLNIKRKYCAYEALGLPKDISKDLIRKVLEEIHNKKNGDTQEAIVKRSGLFSLITKAGLNTSTFLSNLSTVASTPQIQNLIISLSV